MEKTIKTKRFFNNSFFAFIVFIFSPAASDCQEANQPKDTVVIENKPVYINQKVTVQEVNYDYIEMEMTGELYLSSVMPIKITHTLNDCKKNSSFLNGFSIGTVQYLRVNQFILGLGGYIERYQDNVCCCNKTYTRDTIIKYENGNMEKEVVNVLESMNNIEKQNIFTYLSIPVRIGYMFDHENFSFYFRTGINISYLLSNTFYFIEPDQDSIQLTEIPSNKFISPNYTLNAEIAIGYRINKNISIVFTPWYNHSLNYLYRTGSSEILIDRGGIRLSALFLY